MKGAFPPSGARFEGCAREGAGGLEATLVEPVTRPVSRDVMYAHRVQVDPAEMA
jgi:hypothetical protein